VARTVVTGGVGFIGFHLTRALLARGDDATIIDDFSDAPYPAPHKRRNAEDLLREAPRLHIVETSVTHAEKLAGLFDGARTVFHLAALAGVRPSFADPAQYARVNVEGTATVLELARRAGCERFVFASSSSVTVNPRLFPRGKTRRLSIRNHRTRPRSAAPSSSRARCADERRRCGVPLSDISPSTDHVSTPRWRLRSSRATSSAGGPSSS
jgi:nucleoside-diphosphate-sugar epimerase